MARGALSYWKKKGARHQQRCVNRTLPREALFPHLKSGLRVMLIEMPPGRGQNWKNQNHTKTDSFTYNPATLLRRIFQVNILLHLSVFLCH